MDAVAPTGLPDQSHAASQSHLLIYVPGIAEFPGDSGIDDVALRLRASMSRMRGGQYTVSPLIETVESWTAQGRRISPRTPGGRVLAVYEFDYRDALLRDIRRRSLSYQGWLVFVTLVCGAYRLVRTLFRRDGQPWADRLSVAWAGFLLLLFSVYLALILVGGVQVLSSAISETTFGSLTFVKDFLKRLDWLPKTIALLTAVGLLTPRLRAGFTEAVQLWLACVSYVQTGQGQGSATGRLSELITHLHRREPHAHIDVVGFSMGSVIAIDTLFPPDPTPEGDSLTAVRHLVTIGSPLRLIGTFWPERLIGRHPVRGLSVLNVYAPCDLLGTPVLSNALFGLKTDPSTAVPTVTFENMVYRGPRSVDRLGLLSRLLLGGLREHSTYWEPGDVQADSCFMRLPSALYGLD